MNAVTQIPEAAAEGARQIGEVILDVKNISLRFGGVKALTDISFDVREHEIRSIIELLPAPLLAKNCNAGPTCTWPLKT